MRTDERETVANLGMADRLNGGCWRFYSDDPVLVAKLRKVAKAQPAGHGGYWFDVPVESVVFRKPLTDEQRAERIERLKKPQA